MACSSTKMTVKVLHKWVSCTKASAAFIPINPPYLSRASIGCWLEETRRQESSHQNGWLRGFKTWPSGKFRKIWFCWRTFNRRCKKTQAFSFISCRIRRKTYFSCSAEEFPCTCLLKQRSSQNSFSIVNLYEWTLSSKYKCMLTHHINFIFAECWDFISKSLFWFNPFSK